MVTVGVLPISFASASQNVLMLSRVGSRYCPCLDIGESYPRDWNEGAGAEAGRHARRVRNIPGARDESKGGRPPRGRRAVSAGRPADVPFLDLRAPYLELK